MLTPQELELFTSHVDGELTDRQPRPVVHPVNRLDLIAVEHALLAQPGQRDRGTLHRDVEHVQPALAVGVLLVSLPIVTPS